MPFSLQPALNTRPCSGRKPALLLAGPSLSNVVPLLGFAWDICVFLSIIKYTFKLPSETAGLSNKAPLIADHIRVSCTEAGILLIFFSSIYLRIVCYYMIESGHGVGWEFGITCEVSAHSELSGVLFSCLDFSFASLSRMN